MKQKALAVLLAMAMMAGMLTGCGGNSGESGADANTSETNGASDAEKDESADDTGEEVDENEDGTVNNPEAVKVDGDKLVFWSLFAGGDGEFMDQIISDYNSGGPTKQVQSIMLVWDDYYTKLQTAVAAGKGPDLGVSHVSKLPELVDQGVVEPIDSYLDELGVDLSSMYSENSLESVTFDGQVYAIPLDTHAEILYYNTDILEKAGVEFNADGQLDISSWDDFKAILDQCKDVMGEGESVIALPNAGDDPYRLWWATYFQMGGTPLVNDEGTELTIDQDIALQAAEFVKSLYDDGYVMEGITDHQQIFQGGKAAFCIGGTWATGAFEKTENLNFQTQVWPQLFDNDSCWADSHSLVLPVKSGRSEEDSQAAVEFLVGASKDGGLVWAGSGQIPANKEVLEDQEYLDMPYRSGYKAALETAVLPSKSPHFYGMKAAIIESLNGYWADMTDAEATIQGLCDGIESNLD